MTLDDAGLSVFGKQLTIQPSHLTSTIVHWVSPSCVDSSGDIIRLTPCRGCAAHTPLPIGGRRHSSDIIPQCTRKISTLHSLTLPTKKECICHTTTEIFSLYT